MENLLKNDFENNRISVIIAEHPGSGIVSHIEKIIEKMNEKLFVLNSSMFTSGYDIKMAVNEAFEYAKRHTEEHPVLLIDNFGNTIQEIAEKLISMCKERKIKDKKMSDNMRIIIACAGKTAETVASDFLDLSNDNIFSLHEYSVLTPQKVEDTFIECLAKTENDLNAIVCEGICHTFVFDESKIKENDVVIDKMLHELPKEFMTETGGGMSFLCACNDKNGNMWTSEHFTMEKLFALGMAAGRVKCPLPREMWCLLPGNMPYYAVIEK